MLPARSELGSTNCPQVRSVRVLGSIFGILESAGRDGSCSMPYWGNVGSHLSSTTSRALGLPKHRPLESRDIQESTKIHRIPEPNKDSQIPFKIWEPSITSSLNNALQTHADAVQQRLHHGHAVRLRAHEPCKSEVGIQSQGRHNHHKKLGSAIMERPWALRIPTPLTP